MIAKKYRPLAAGLLASLASALALYFMGETALEQQREFYFDALTQAIPAANLSLFREIEFYCACARLELGQ